MENKLNYTEKRFIDIHQIFENGVILFVTATDTESVALHTTMTPLPDEEYLIETKKDNNTYYIGKFGHYTIVHVECTDMGSSSSGGSIITISNAINHTSPKFVLMIGIAFGINEEKQNIGDVLVSKTITSYEVKRLGQENSIWRGSKVEATLTLRNNFKNIKGWNYILPNGNKANLNVCEILSGEKLVDNYDYREQLKFDFPDAKGGEMEGVGLYAACNNNNVDWILVKSICDYADGEKREGKKEKQALAIKVAIDACLQVFNKKYVFDDYFPTAPLNNTSSQITIASLSELIDAGQIPTLFAQLDKIKIDDKAQYNMFKMEFKAGLHGRELIQWNKRMKVFILDLNI